MKTDKPREFWIAQGSHADVVRYSKKEAEDLGWSARPIHVIEYSAYESLQNKLDIAVEALKSICDNRCAIGINPCSAREALNKIEKLKVEGE